MIKFGAILHGIYAAGNSLVQKNNTFLNQAFIVTQ